MSRRAKRRGAAVQGKQSKGKAAAIKWGWRIASILALALILAGFGLYYGMQSYLRSDDFRVFIGDSVGGAIDSKAEFELFEWEGMDVRTGGFHAESNGLLQEVKADGLQARLSLAGVRRGVWEISDLRISKLSLDLATARSRGGVSASSDDRDDSIATDVQKSDDGFLVGLLPDRAELSSAEVISLDLDLQTSSGGLVATDLAMRVDAGGAAGSYDLNVSGGVIESSWFSPSLDLISARGKYQHGRLFITDSQSKVYERGLLTLNGEIEGRKFGFFATLKDVRSEELLPEHWQKRLMGDVEAQLKIKSGMDGVSTRGKIELKHGVLTGLPVLDRIAAYSNTRRFQRLHLSEAKLQFWKEGNRLDLTDIVMASEGLVRVEGQLSVVDGRLDGRFKVGVMPGTLAHIPGAETKVFIRGDKGLLWSPLRITGTMDAPKEDLSDRMIAAAGERMFELVPETGLMALKFAHDTATKLPAKAVESGVDVIREGSDVIQQGVRGVFDLLPGGGEE